MTKEEIRDVILSRDRANKIKSTAFDVTGGELRRIVHGLRIEGYHIASDRGGYWGAETEEDRQATLKFLKPKFLQVISVYKQIENWKLKPILFEEKT